MRKLVFVGLLVFAGQGTIEQIICADVLSFFFFVLPLIRRRRKMRFLKLKMVILSIKESPYTFMQEKCIMLEFQRLIGGIACK